MIVDSKTKICVTFIKTTSDGDDAYLHVGFTYDNVALGVQYLHSRVYVDGHWYRYYHKQFKGNYENKVIIIEGCEVYLFPVDEKEEKFLNKCFKDHTDKAFG